MRRSKHGIAIKLFVTAEEERPMRRIPIVLGLLLAALNASAQIRSVNEAGVSAGHEHLRVNDVDAQLKFWNALGGETIQVGNQQVIKMPGIILMFTRNAGRGGAPPAPLLGSEGSTVDSIGFKVKNLKDSLTKWEAAGIKPLPGGTAKQAIVMAPDNIKVQVTEDASVATAVTTDELLMKVPSAAEAQAWYVKHFGGKPSKQGSALLAEIPGMNIRFVETKDAVAGTQGRSIDHIGFEVKNLEEFMKKLSEAGVKVNRPYGPLPATLAPLKSLAFITDPWGTYIELNEGFGDVK